MNYCPTCGRKITARFAVYRVGTAGPPGLPRPIVSPTSTVVVQPCGHTTAATKVRRATVNADADTRP